MSELWKAIPSLYPTLTLKYTAPMSKADHLLNSRLAWSVSRVSTLDNIFPFPPSVDIHKRWLESSSGISPQGLFLWRMGSNLLARLWEWEKTSHYLPATPTSFIPCNILAPMSIFRKVKSCTIAIFSVGFLSWQGHLSVFSPLGPHPFVPCHETSAHPSLRIVSMKTKSCFSADLLGVQEEVNISYPYWVTPLGFPES